MPGGEKKFNLKSVYGEILMSLAESAAANILVITLADNTQVKFFLRTKEEQGQLFRDLNSSQGSITQGLPDPTGYCLKTASQTKDMPTIEEYRQQLQAGHLQSTGGVGAGAPAIDNSDLFRVHKSPMIDRDVAPEVVPEMRFAASSVTTRDAILNERGTLGDEADPLVECVQWGEVVQNSSSRSNYVFQLLAQRLKTMPRAWLEKHKHIHFMTDYDGVVDLPLNEFKHPMRPSRPYQGRGESDEAYQQRLQTYENDRESYDRFEQAKKAYFSKCHQTAAANIEAGKMGAYLPDDGKISRILNAIFNEDHPDKVHVFLDDREDILTTVYNFFREYSHLIKGRLALYKENKQTGAVTLCEWQQSQKPEYEETPFILKDPATSPEITNYAAFTANRPVAPEDRKDLEKCDQLHADWLMHLAKTVSEDAQRHIVEAVPRATAAEATDEVEINITPAFTTIKGEAAPEAFASFDERHQIISMLNGICHALCQATPKKHAQGGRLDYADMVAYRWRQFHLELQAIHLRARIPVAEYALPEHYGEIPLMAAMAASRITEIIDRCGAVSPSQMLNNFLRLFPVEQVELSQEFRDLLLDVPRIKRRQSKLVTATTEGVEIDIERGSSFTLEEMAERFKPASEPDEIAKQSALSALWNDLDKLQTMPTTSWGEFTAWFDSMDVDPADFDFYVPKNRKQNPLGKKPMYLARLAQQICQRHVIQSSPERELAHGVVHKQFRILPFETRWAAIRNDLIREGCHFTHAGFKQVVWVLPERTEDQDQVLQYSTTIDGVADTGITEVPVAAASMPSSWGGLRDNLADALQRSTEEHKKAHIEALFEYHGGQQVFGDRLYLTGSDWLTTVARRLLAAGDCVSFRESEEGQRFFTDLADILDFPQGNAERIYIVQDMWQTLLQAYALGQPKIILQISDQHKPGWYVHLMQLCENSIFFKREHRTIARDYATVDMLDCTVRNHCQCVLRQYADESVQNMLGRQFLISDEAVLTADAGLNLEQSFVALCGFENAVVDTLLAPYVELNPSLSSAARFVTTETKILSFIHQMRMRLFISPANDAQIQAHRLLIKAYSIALMKLCALPFEEESEQVFNAEAMLNRFKHVLMQLGVDADEEARQQLPYCFYQLSSVSSLQLPALAALMKTFYAPFAQLPIVQQSDFVATWTMRPELHHLLPQTLSATGAVNSWLGFNAGEGDEGLDGFRELLMSHPELGERLRNYLQTNTRPQFLRKHPETGATITIDSKYAFETTPEFLTQLVLDLSEACLQSSSERDALLLMLLVVLSHPVNATGNTEILPAEIQKEEFSADKNMAGFHGHLEHMITNGLISPQQVFALYQYFSDYLNALLHAQVSSSVLLCYKVQVELAGVFDEEVAAITQPGPSIIHPFIVRLLENADKSKAGEVAPVTVPFVAMAGDAAMPARNIRQLGWPTSRPESVDVICTRANCLEFLARFDLRHFDDQKPKGFWQRAHKWGEAMSSLAPALAAWYAIPVELVRDAMEDFNASYDWTTAVPNENVSKTNHVLFAAIWGVVEFLFFLERMVATSGYFPGLVGKLSKSRAFFMAVSLFISVSSISATAVYKLFPNNITLGDDFQTALIEEVGKAHAGSILTMHANGFSLLVAPLVAVMGCGQRAQRALFQVARIWVLMALLAQGIINTVNPLASMFFEVGHFQDPVSVELEGVSNLLTAFIGIGAEVCLPLGLASKLLHSSYRMALGYRIAEGVLFTAAAAITIISGIVLAVSLLNYLAGSEQAVNPDLEAIYTNRQAIMWGIVGLGSLGIAFIAAAVECTRNNRVQSKHGERRLVCSKSQAKRRSSTATNRQHLLVRSHSQPEGLAGSRVENIGESARKDTDAVSSELDKMKL